MNWIRFVIVIIALLLIYQWRRIFKIRQGKKARAQVVGHTDEGDGAFCLILSFKDETGRLYEAKSYKNWSGYISPPKKDSVVVIYYDPKSANVVHVESFAENTLFPILGIISLGFIYWLAE